MVVLCTCLLSTAAMLVVNLRAHHMAVRAEFERMGEQVRFSFERRLQLPGYGLGGARGTLAALDGEMDVDAFRRYVRSRDLKKEFPGVTGFGLISRTVPADLEQAPDEHDNHGAQKTHTTDRTRDSYVLRAIEPFAGSAAALVYDERSEPTRLRALERAFQTGLPSATAPIRLPQDARKQLGSLYFLPVFAAGGPQSGGQSDEVIAAVFAAVTYETLLADVADQDLFAVEFALVDTAAKPDDRKIFGSTRPIRTEAQYRASHTFEFGGRQLNLDLSSSERFEEANAPVFAWWFALAGILASLLAAGLVVQLASTHSHALRIARQMTEQLERLAMVARHTRAGMAVLDRSARLLWANPVFLSLSGFGESDLVRMRPWDRLLHPDTPAETQRELRRALTMHVPFEGDVALKPASGEEIWVWVVIEPVQEEESTPDGFVVTVAPKEGAY